MRGPWKQRVGGKTAVGGGKKLYGTPIHIKQQITCLLIVLHIFTEAFTKLNLLGHKSYISYFQQTASMQQDFSKETLLSRYFLIIFERKWKLVWKTQAQHVGFQEKNLL